ncbi:response regulator [Halomonas sp. GXIMD04776]|uniref:response regulator n=1 Tax=Halomonas sp. GXIMD04776 TaxID=3415605 RepID=UPI003CC021D6
MQGIAARKNSRNVLRQRLARAALPVLVAEICFFLICLGVGVWLWQDIEQRERQEHQRSLLQTQVLQTRLIDQHLIEQQRHLRQLGLAVRRALQTEVTPSAPTAMQADVPYHMAPSGTMMLFGEALQSTGERLKTLLPQLYLLEPSLDGLYQSDTLIKRIVVSLPQGLSALVPANAVPANIDELDWPYPPIEAGSVDGNASPLGWHAQRAASMKEMRIAAHYDVTDLQGEALARLWLELDVQYLAQLLQESLGPGIQAWLVDEQDKGLLRAAPVDLPDDAGRRGIVSLKDDDLPIGEKTPAQLIWTTLPTNGWRLVSVQHSSPTAHAGGNELFWLALIWSLGSLLLLGVLSVLMNRSLRRWDNELKAPVERIATLRQRVAGWAPAWSPPLPPPERKISEASARGLPDELPQELDALESTLDALKRQPQLGDLLETLAMPAALTLDDLLMVVNPAFERLVGHSQRELQGLNDSLFLIPNEDDDGYVRVKGRDDTWRVMQRVTSDDGYGYSLILLIDESKSRHQMRQLSLARELAQQDAQLKSHYLALLRRELKILSEELGKSAEPDVGLREHGSMMMELLDNLNEENDALFRQVTPKPPSSQRGRSARILIVDDGPVNTVLARDVLSRKGLVVDTAGGGDEALALMEQHFYDLVFMDIFMPAPDGVETTRRWREREQEQERKQPGQGERRSVLVALTANASERDRERFFAAGMDDYVAKPYRPQALIDMIRRWLPDVTIA